MIGDVVFSLFPLADEPRFKSRPCLVISSADPEGDIEVLKITSKNLEKPGRIRLKATDFAKGGLPIDSALVIGDLAKTHVSTITRYAGQLEPKLVQAILKARIAQNTRAFSRLTHTANRPGDDPFRLAAEEVASGEAGVESATRNPQPAASEAASQPATGTRSVPYAGRVFTEDEVEAAVSATLDFWLTLGPEGEAFEKELAAFLGVKHSLLVNSGSSANLIALSCLTTHKLPDHKRIHPGDEVITCAAGFPTTVAPIVQNGCIPVFIDNDPTTGNARVEQLEAAYSPGKTKAVMMAHTLGNPFDVAAVLAFCKKYDLWLIEDNCDALGCTYTMPVELAKELGLDHLLKIAEKGDHPIIRFSEVATRNPQLITATTGSFGDLSTQSFYPPHHLTMGEGGAVNIIRRPPLKTYAESFRDWGRDCWCPSGKDNTCGKRFGWNLGELPPGYDHKYIYSHLGYNVKPLDPQAAIGRVQLRRLPAFIEARKQNWEILRRGLADLEEYFDFSLPTHATAWLAPSGVDRRLKKEDVDSPSPISVLPSSQRSCFSWDSSQCRTDCSWFGFMLRVKTSAPFTVREFAAYLDDHKVGNRMLFGGNLLRQPVFVQLRKDNPNAFRIADVPAEDGRQKMEDGASPISDLQSTSPALSGADEIMHTALFLGTYPGLSQAQLDYEIAVIRDFVASHSRRS
jgi:CDP-6-deoxy-D-xylo-4-hexulose-3-dehydrase